MNLNTLIKSPSQSRHFFLWLFLTALFIRFPFFFRDYIDKDESTFILMGQAWAEGYLPYTYLWDLKPPLAFAYFAAVITVFGKSFFWIRLGGVLLVTATAYTAYQIAIKSKVNKTWAQITAFGSLLFSSLFGSVQGVMSEHISMFFFMTGLYFLICFSNKAWPYIVAGGLLGLSAMAKLNLAYPILLIGLYTAYKELQAFKKDKTNKPCKSLWLALGGLIGIGITALPYLLENKLEMWWESIFMASGSYAQINLSNSFILLPFIGGLGGYISWRKSETNSLIGLALMGVLGSFVMAGKLNGHYLLQAYPLIFLLGSLAGKNKEVKLTKWSLLLLLLLPIESYKEYAHLYKNQQQQGRWHNGEGVDIPSYLAEKHPNITKPLFFEYHIGYWLLGQKPPSMAVTHPSNLFRPRLFPYFNQRKSSQEELVYLLDSVKPGLIVIDQKHSLFKTHPTEKAYFEKQIEVFYVKDTLIGKGLVYLRK